MSIAVSAIVLPSRLLGAMVGAMCAAVAAIGLAVALGQAGELSFALRWLAGGACVFAAVFGFYHGVGCRKPIHIDISGTGRIRLSEASAGRSCRHEKRPHLDMNEQEVWLMGSSTIWPHLLLLRLQDKDGNITTVPILPDCVSRDSFRALSVACRWIVSHGVQRQRETS